MSDEFKEDIESAQRALLKYIEKLVAQQDRIKKIDDEFLQGFEVGWRYAEGTKGIFHKGNLKQYLIVGPTGKPGAKPFGEAIGYLVGYTRFNFTPELRDVKPYLKLLTGTPFFDAVKKIIEEEQAKHLT